MNGVCSVQTWLSALDILALLQKVMTRQCQESACKRMHSGARSSLGKRHVLLSYGPGHSLACVHQTTNGMSQIFINHETAHAEKSKTVRIPCIW